jgi:transglutaminase-like putative cysteine protease
MQSSAPRHDSPIEHVDRREVMAYLEADVADVADIALAIAVADLHEYVERLTVTLGGQELQPVQLVGRDGGRLHLLRDVPAGRLVVHYEAEVTGTAPSADPTDLEWFEYVRPSRYCESDQLGPFARAEFTGLGGLQLLDAVSSWVGTNVAYVPGASRPIDGAVETLLGRAGVCRDFAHLTAALLRANGVATRMASVYAPGLDPMDFHAVAEAAIDGRWRVVDPTCLAPRQSMVRIATGADATDTAFMTTVRGAVELEVLEVGATVSPYLPSDDISALVSLA